MAAPSENGRIRFGAFDFHPETRELRRDGIPVRLQPQPAQVLALLLAHPGEIVSRDTLRDALWGADTVVDFDRGLNFCIAQIRLALGDSSDSPLYIKTVPKRGYQFIAPVTTASPAPEAPAPPADPRPRLIALALALLLAAALFLVLRNSAPHPPRVAVARFENQTGDPQLDRVADALTDEVIVELAAAENHLAVIGNAAILRQPRPQRDLLAIHEALRADYILLVSLQRHPAGLQAFLQFITLPGQNHIKVARIPVNTSADSPELARRIVQTVLTVFPKR